MHLPDRKRGVQRENALVWFSVQFTCEVHVRRQTTVDSRTSPPCMTKVVVVVRSLSVQNSWLLHTQAAAAGRTNENEVRFETKPENNNVTKAARAHKRIPQTTDLSIKCRALTRRQWDGWPGLPSPNTDHALTLMIVSTCVATR